MRTSSGWLKRLDLWKWFVGSSLTVAIVRGAGLPKAFQEPFTAVQFFLLLAAIAVLWVTPSTQRRKIKWPSFAMLGFGSFAVATTLWSAAPGVTLPRSILFLLLMVFIVESVRSRWTGLLQIRADLNSLFWIAVGIAGLGLILALFQVPGMVAEYDRVRGITANATVVAWIAAIAFPFGYVHILSVPMKRSWLFLAGCVVLGAAVLASGTRGALLAIFIGTGIVHGLRLWRRLRVRKTRHWIIDGLILVLVTCAAVVTVTGVFEIGRVVETKTDVSSGRLGLWAQGLDLWLQRPLTGWGYGSTSTLESFSGASGMTLHNAYWSALLETGIVGLVLLAAILVGAIFRRGPLHQPGIFVGCIAVVINGLFESSLVGLGSPVTLQSWLVIGLLIAYGQLPKSHSVVDSRSGVGDMRNEEDASRR